MILNAKIGVFK